MSENNPPIDWVEYTLRFIFAFITSGILVAAVVFIVWNTALPNYNFYVPGIIWFTITTSISIWTARTDRWRWFHSLIDWFIWW